ncbi:MAG: DUF4043 family protein [Helicobacteraceae bacterium]|jgi:N4-gp56 family major capsid protein|nr:DUF4043 family protein [Helicobacteraceae bacterium]
MAIELSPQEKTNWGRAITADSMSQSFFRSFIANNDNAIIKTKLETQAPSDKGIYSVVPLVLPLNGSGVEGNTDFAANQDELQKLTQAVRFRLFGNSLTSEVRQLEDRAIVSWRSEAKPALTTWAINALDRRIITELSNGCTNIAAADASNGVKPANSTATIAAGDVLSTKTIDELVKRARNGFDGAGNPHPKVKPVMVKQGKNAAGIDVYERLWVLLIGGYQSAQLKSDPVWIATQQEANDRGERNPLFTGIIGKYNGVAVVDWDTWSADTVGVVTSATTYNTEAGALSFANYAGAGGLETEVGLFLGAKAGLLPQDEGFRYYEDHTIDAGRKTLIGIDRGLGFAKAHWIGEKAIEKSSVYHDKDFGVIAVVASKE